MSLTFILIFSLFCRLPENNETIRPDEISFESLKFNSKKAVIWENLGEVKPKRVYYECGFYSEEEQGKPFFELIYADVIWLGNEEDYLLEKVMFDTKGETKLRYRNVIFTGKTTQGELEELFNQKSESIKVSGRENENLESIGLSFEKRDDGCLFFFKNGKLIEFGYWSPC